MSLCAVALVLLGPAPSVSLPKEGLHSLLDENRFGSTRQRIDALRRLPFINDPLARDCIAEMLFDADKAMQKEATLLIMEHKILAQINHDKSLTYNKIIESTDRDWDVERRLEEFDRAQTHSRLYDRYEKRYFENIKSLAPTVLSEGAVRWLSALAANANLGEGHWYTGSIYWSIDYRGEFFLYQVRNLVETDEEMSIELLNAWTGHRAAVLISALATRTKNESREYKYGELPMPSHEAMEAIKAKRTDKSLEVMRALTYKAAQYKERDLLPYVLKLRDHSDPTVSLNAWLAVMRMEGESYWGGFLEALPKFETFHLFTLGFGHFMGNELSGFQLEFVTQTYYEEFRAAFSKATAARRLAKQGGQA